MPTRGSGRKKHCGTTGRGVARTPNTTTSCAGSFAARVWCHYTGQGSAGRGARRYRCHGPVNNPERKDDAKLISADWLDDAVWRETRQFILNPGPALEEARRSLRENMAEAVTFEERRRDKQHEIAQVKARQAQALELFRIGGVDPKQAKREMTAYARDIGRLEGEAESLRATAALVDAQEALFTESTALLARLRDELAEIEATNDLIRKREVIEQYVREVVVETRRVSAHRLEATVTVRVRLKPEPVVIEDGTPWTTTHDGRSRSSACSALSRAATEKARMVGP